MNHYHHPTHWPLGIVAAAIFIALLALGATLEGPDDTAAAQASADWLHDSQTTAQQTSAAEREARTTCARLYGPQAQVLTTTDGDWVCRRAGG